MGEPNSDPVGLLSLLETLILFLENKGPTTLFTELSQGS